jgi:hypothetical protein
MAAEKDTRTLSCAGDFQGCVEVTSYDIPVRDLRAKILEAASALASEPILDVKLIVSGRNLTVCCMPRMASSGRPTCFQCSFCWHAQGCTLPHLQDPDKLLSQYGVTSASRILVLKHADTAAKRAMDAASERETRMKRLRYFVI